MRRRQGVRDLHRIVQRLSDVQGAASETLGERLPLEELHHQIRDLAEQAENISDRVYPPERK